MDEQVLIRQLQDARTRESAFRLLVKEYQEALYWQVRKIVISHDDADDVLQNALVKAWKGIEQFRGESKLKTWLFRIATNEALTHLRREKSRNLGELADIQDSLLHSLEQESVMSGDEIEVKLQRAVISLPEKQRLVFQMKYYDEMKYEEMAEVLGGTVGSLKASFHHAVKKIESFLTGD
ncbi:MAG: sigma-70 family RNA polymerase sigma factor [Bacteroidia bacterium]|nr:sigma-70 family RNA polymerase sigma factor [Bacteroidia bacterium]